MSKRKPLDPGFLGKMECQRKHWSPRSSAQFFKSVQRLALTRYGHDLRHLHLCDNLGVVLSIERCRSKNLKL